MNCKEFSNLLDAWIDGTLPDGEAERMRAHAAECGECASLYALRMDCRRLDEDIEVPGDFSSSWRQMIREEETAEESTEKARRSFVWQKWLAVAAALVFVVGGTLLSRDRLPGRTAASSKSAQQTTEAAKQSSADDSGAALPAPTPELFIAAGGAANAVPEEEALGIPLADYEENVYLMEACEEAAFDSDALYEEPAEAEWAANESWPAAAATAAPAAPEAAYDDVPLMEMEAAYETALDCDLAEEAEELAAPEAAVGFDDAEEAVESAAPDETAESASPEEAEESMEAAPDQPSGYSLRDLLEDGLEFLKDMGAFLLAALPWLAGAAVAGLVIWLIVKKTKNRKNMKE